MEPPPKKRCPHSTTAPELTLGAPRAQAASGRYVTKGGVTIDRLVQPLADPSEALVLLLRAWTRARVRTGSKLRGPRRQKKGG